jgi:ferritin-like metal-binding protein YciE
MASKGRSNGSRHTTAAKRTGTSAPHRVSAATRKEPHNVPEGLEKLFIEQLKDIYGAEKQLLRAIPKMAKRASKPELETGFNEHLEQTRGHVERLESIFESIGRSPVAKKCEAMEGLIEEARGVVEEDFDPATMDAALIGAAQKIEHYEIATYGTLRTFAETMGRDQVAALLQQSLEEERATDESLTRLAEAGINAEAAEPSQVEARAR